jgi:hypothetical protein
MKMFVVGGTSSELDERTVAVAVAVDAAVVVVAAGVAAAPVASVVE